MSDTISGFTIEQEQDYNRSKKVQKYFAVPANVIKVNSYKPLKDEVKDLNDNINHLEGVLPRKTASTSGITTGKTLTKLDVANIWGIMCGIAEGYANKFNKSELAKDMHHSASEIFHAKQGDVLGLCKHVNDVLSPLVGDVNFDNYEITALRLSNGMLAATAFNNQIGSVGAADADKVAANADIEADLKKISHNISQIVLLIKHFLSLTTPDTDFVNGFVAANVIDDIGVHHSGLDGYVKDAIGNFIFKATITNKRTGRSVDTNAGGHYHAEIMPLGDTEFEGSAPGKKTQSKIITIKKGKIISIDWTLENL